jgi:S1-C subfamily serine protease
MIQGGGDRSWLIRQQADGTRKTDSRGARVVGNHRGFYEGLNIRNPQPGYRYQWASIDPRDQYSSKLKGWEIVSDGDPDSPAYKAGLDGGDYQVATGSTDTANVFKDVVLVRTSEENYRRLQAQVQARSLAAMEDNSDAFLQGASPEELATGNTNQGQVQTRLARADHATVRREGGQITEQIRPQGIMRE